MFSIEMCRLRFSLIAKGPIILPSYKGSALHGGFGHALEAISPTWFSYFFQQQTQSGNDIPRPYVLLPPLDKQQSYQAHEKFQCELTLFAEATRHVAIVQAAIEYLGSTLGLGYNQGKFSIADITEETFSNIQSQSYMNPQMLSLRLITRMRLKSKGQLQRQSPAFSLLIERLLGRLKTLQRSYSNKEKSINNQQYQKLLQQARDIKTLDSSVYWDDWDRYSSRQKEWMKFGGLLGELRFQGDLQPFMPYLQLGEWCHIGGKNSFGLGKYLINVGDSYAHTSP